MELGGEGTKITRRDFLKIVGAGAASLGLNACGVRQAPETQEQPAEPDVFCKQSFGSDEEKLFAVKEAEAEYLVKVREAESLEEARTLTAVIGEKGEWDSFPTIDILFDTEEQVTVVTGYDSLMKVINGDEKIGPSGTLFAYGSPGDIRGMLREYQKNNRPILSLSGNGDNPQRLVGPQAYNFLLHPSQ
jgi:hypothetical protein